MKQVVKASVAVCLALVVSIGIYLTATRGETENPLPAAAFPEDIIRTQEVATYKKAAASGDCRAKLEPAHYYNEGRSINTTKRCGGIARPLVALASQPKVNWSDT